MHIHTFRWRSCIGNALWRYEKMEKECQGKLVWKDNIYIYSNALKSYTTTSIQCWFRCRLSALMTTTCFPAQAISLALHFPCTNCFTLAAHLSFDTCKQSLERAKSRTARTLLPCQTRWRGCFRKVKWVRAFILQHTSISGSGMDPLCSWSDMHTRSQTAKDEQQWIIDMWIRSLVCVSVWMCFWLNVVH